ncbi:MAG: NrtA/SsuA/CpmA family ABC transporter substrate-binding protein [Desulfuromusa sp.]|nr:NrtA/SsuA/CpmA family ABC transporter substrate-binding protein [Desulfuromusa sp.]
MADRKIRLWENLKILGLILLLTCVSCTDPAEKSVTTLEKVRIASVPAIVEAPTHIAYHNKYFEQEGLDVSLKINPDGKTSLEQLLNGEADIITVTGTPVVYSSLKGNDFAILANIDHSKIHFIVARKDRGIRSIADLKGKKVTVMFGTSGQFFMDSLLLLNRLKTTDLEIINLNGPAQLKAFVDGEVDAIFGWVPFPLLALQKLGDKAILLPSDPIRSCSWVVVTTKKYVAENPDMPKKILKALIAAEDFISQNREQASVIHAEISGVKTPAASDLFKTMEFGLSLRHSLLLDFEDQARWILKNGYSDAKQIPNYLNYIYPDAMKAVKPEAVTLIY